MSHKKPIEIKEHENYYEVLPKGVYESTVVSSGNGAVIKFYKRFLGEKVIVIVKDNILEKEEQGKKLSKIWIEHS